MVINIKCTRINLDLVETYFIHENGNLVFKFNSKEELVIETVGYSQAMAWIDKIDNLLNVTRIDFIKE